MQPTEKYIRIYGTIVANLGFVEMDRFIRRIGHYVNNAEQVGAHIAALEGRIIHKKAQQTLIETGVVTQYVYILQEGWAIRHRSVDDGRRQIVNFMLPGDIFDLHSLSKLTADHTVTTITDCRFRAIPNEQFLKGLRMSGDVATAFWWAAVQEESILREQIVRVGRLSAKERIGHLLLELHWRASRLQGEDEENEFYFPITRVDIADALGLTPIHVSRCMRVLKNQKMIEETRTTMRLLSPERMACQSQFSTDYLHMRRLEL